MNNKCVLYFVLTIVTMALGLLSRSGMVPLTSFLIEYSGDTLWALMVYWIFRTAFSNIPTRYIVIMAMAFSFGIEFAQLYHAPWIDAIRANRLGGLVLGFGFKISDLLCYFVGIMFGAGVDEKYLRKSMNNVG